MMITKNDMVDVFATGCKQRQDFKIGVEHEQFVYKNFTTQPRRASYEEKGGILDLLHYFETFGYEKIVEDNHVIALHDSKTKANISLEPGGQFELSGAPLSSLAEVQNELQIHFQRLAAAENALDLKFIATGFDSLCKLNDIPWMPKKRYDIMKAYMPTVGSMGHEMMKRTCTVQVNLDYSSEQDMAKKMRTAMALQPVIAGFFANSPHQHHNTLYKTFRTHVWQNTDANRSGILKCVFDRDFGFETYVDYLLSVPMYFVKRNGQYHNVAGANFNDFISGNLEQLPNEQATLVDFEDHITVAFPEVRLKKFLELRGADSGGFDHIMSITKLWVDILYDANRLDAMHDIVTSWSYADVQTAYQNIAISGSATILKNRTISDWMTIFQNELHIDFNQKKDS